MIALAARCILQEFDAYNVESRQIPTLAKKAFEDCDPGESRLLSLRRLSIYSESIRDLAAQLKRVYPLLAEDEHLWQKVEKRYLPFIRGRYEEDFAMAYIHSARRMIYRSEEHTSELQSLMSNSYAVFCLKKKNKKTTHNT